MKFLSEKITGMIIWLNLFLINGCVKTAVTKNSLTEYDESKQKPNFILLFADDLGYGDLSCYGHPTIRTPIIDRMAEEGIRLTSFYAAPWCVPSRAQLITGRYITRIELGDRTGVDGKGGLPSSEITLAEALKEQGYTTAMLGKWHLGYIKKQFLPTENGFDSYFGIPYSNDYEPPWFETETPLHLYRGTEPTEEYPVDQSTLTTRYTEEAVKFIKENAEETFFLYFAYNMPHMPLNTTTRFKRQSRAGLYGDVIETIDWSVGCILQTLKDEGIEENTLVIFTSDNGPWADAPPRMIQAGNKPWHAGTTGLLRGSKQSTYEGGLRVPAIFWWPGNIPPRQVSDEIATVMDVYLTLIETGGGSLPEDYTVDGNNIMPLLTGETRESPTKEFYYIAKMEQLRGVREGEWKLHFNSDGEKELFNLYIDPGERYNRVKDNPEILERLEEKLRQFGKETGAELPEEQNQ